jgi:hypothetical protein
MEETFSVLTRKPWHVKGEKFTVHSKDGCLTTIDLETGEGDIVGIGKPESEKIGRIPESDLLLFSKGKPIFYMYRRGSKMGHTAMSTPPITRVKREKVIN